MGLDSGRGCAVPRANTTLPSRNRNAYVRAEKGTLPSGGHHCFIYGEAAEARGIVGPFVDQRLHLNRRVLFLGSGETEEAVSALVREDGFEGPMADPRSNSG